MRLLLPMIAAAACALQPVVAVEAPWPGIATVEAGESLRLTVPMTSGPALEVTIHLPAATGPWPVVLFSHGLGGSRDGYAFLGRHWAGHGYVVIHPTHAGSDGSLIHGTMGESAPRLRQAVRDPLVLRGRPASISAVIDALPTIPAIAGRIDGTRIGVAGHSFGAWTTAMVAGLKARGFEAADPRPTAFIALSPQGPSERMPADGCGAITRPFLIVTGSEDRQPAFLDPAPDHDGRWRASLFDLLPHGNAALAWIEGARHSTFSGGAGSAMLGEPPVDPRHLAAVKDLTLAWWDWRLKGSAAAAAWVRRSWAVSGTGLQFRER